MGQGILLRTRGRAIRVPERGRSDEREMMNSEYTTSHSPKKGACYGVSA